MENVKLVIFDMDGLILDTEKLYLEYGLEVFDELGYKITNEIFQKTVGLNDESCDLYYTEIFGEDFNYNIIVEKVNEKLLKASKNKEIDIKKGFFELIEFLEENKINKVVATSTNREKAEYMLTNAGLLEMFDFIVCGDEVLHGKPDPEIFLKAAEKMGVKPMNTIVLEDSYNGLKAAKAAGMFPIMIPDLLEVNDEMEKIIYKNVNNLENIIDLFK